MLGYVADTTQEAADTFYPGYAKAMTDIGKERGWPPMTRASFDAQRGPNGALLIGQAGSSSRIDNYLGFPTGISGLDLTARAYAQAQKFGAQVMIAKGATGLACDRQPYHVKIDGGSTLAGRAVIIATGAEYRRPALGNLSQFEGAGVYYTAMPMEAQLCVGEDVIIIGGGNSAGQAAVFLAQTAERVHMLVPGNGLADTMSRYLIRRIEDNPAIE